MIIMRTIQLAISGNVQGVGFRYHAKEKADELGIKGWITNAQDGTVKVVACGSETQISQFIEWCGQGPQLASVDLVETQEESEACEMNDFSIII